MALSRTWLSLSLFALLTLSASNANAGLQRVGKTIQVTVDATTTQRKFLRTHLTMPVQSGALTLYYPKWIPGEHGPNGPIADLTGLKFEGGGKSSSCRRN